MALPLLDSDVEVMGEGAFLDAFETLGASVWISALKPI